MIKFVQDSLDNKRFEDACRSLDDLPDNVKGPVNHFKNLINDHC